MPADIRSFFGGKGSQGASSQEKQPTKTASKSEDVNPKGRSKRKVIDDSDEDQEDLKGKAASPKKAPPKRKKESPKGEATTTSDYFGSKKKPTRSTPTKPRLSAAKDGHPGIQRDLTPRKPETTKRIPKGSPKTATLKSRSAGPSAESASRTSARKAGKKSYAESADSDDDVPLLEADEDSGDDIHGAQYRRTGKKMEDDYESDEDMEDVLPTRQKQPVSSNGRKRKSADLSDEDEELIADSKKKKKSAPKPVAKKPRAPPIPKSDVTESKEIQDIFDSIPTVRPPTPPPQLDKPKKFDFKASASRGQALNAGSKEIPEGAENCLAGLAFVFTGILDSLPREEGQALVKRYGGKVTTAPSSKTDYVVLGSDAGPSKIKKIHELNIKTIAEDGLFDLIRKLPANGGSGKAAKKAEEKKQVEEKQIQKAAEEMSAEIEKEEHKKRKNHAASTTGRGSTSTPKIDDQLWTVKYAPTQMNQICGNKTSVERLQNWLRNWQKSAKANFKKGGPDGSGIYRAVIVHGGPGIGKTTAAHLVAKLEGYDVVESNASDTRSKKMVETGLKGVLDTTSLLGYFSGDGQKVDSAKKKLVLIMDEVDGMSAGDRGGVGAMAAICKKTNIPIILICNDRKLPKMKPFDYVTYDVPFRKPTTDQVRSRIMTILFREGMKDMVPPTVVNALIEGANADIRRIINMISTAKIDQQYMNFNEGKKMASAWEKQVILKPWDIAQKILGGGLFAQSSKTTLNEKIELYFNDHEFSSLMLQENYLHTNPMLSLQFEGKQKKMKQLELVDKAAESISDGDLVDSMIHGSQQQWSLMPTHAVFSFVRPASFVSGSTAGHRVGFTSWLGNNSKTGKLSRYVKEIQGHMRLRASGDRHEIRQQYLPVLWTRLVKALEEHGNDSQAVEDIITLMDSYFLTKDDWDAIAELGVGPQDFEKLNIPSQSKGAFTRKYNSVSHPLPFMKAGGPLAPAKKAKEKPDLEEALEESEDDELVEEVADESEEELDLKKDKYVRAPKKRASAQKGSKAKKGDDDQSEDDSKGKSRKAGTGKTAGAKRGRGKK